MPRGWFIILGDKAPITFTDVEMEKVPTVNKNGGGKQWLLAYIQNLMVGEQN